jgi:hypothetical protein
MINEVKKDLYKSKNDAIFSHYSSGNLYYNVDVLDGTYQFPIATVEEIEKEVTENGIIIEVLELADDLGTTPFTAKMYGAHLNRWIQRAIENDEFIKIK